MRVLYIYILTLISYIPSGGIDIIHILLHLLFLINALSSLAQSTTSPFGSKCNCIHEHPIGVSENELRLVKVPNKQFRDPGASTDVDVDYFRIPIICEVNYGPLGRGTFSLFSNLDTFRKSVCNIRDQGNAVDKQRCQVALAFYKTRQEKRFEASHCAFEQFPCMVVQKKRFLLTEDGSVHELASSRNAWQNTRTGSTITVHELAFDHMQSSADRSKPPPALWFNIPEEAIKKISTDDVKRITRKEKDLKRVQGGKQAPAFRGKDFYKTYVSHTHNYEVPFHIFYARLNDSSDVHGLIIQTLVEELGGETKVGSLQKKFEGVKLALKFDYWPSSSATKDPKKYDYVPPVSRAYDIHKSNDKKALIDSFRHNLNKSGDRDNSETTSRKSRLPIFALIAAQEKE